MLFITTDFEHVVIAVVFNIHVDNLTDKTESEFCGVLSETFDLLQHVKEAAHKRGRTLDLVTSKAVDISNTVVEDAGLSDHFWALFGMTDFLRMTNIRRIMFYTGKRDGIRNII